MVRAISFFAMGSLFLLISPGLRGSVLGGIQSVADGMVFYAPWSYVGGVMLVLFAVVFSFNRGSQPR